FHGIFRRPSVLQPRAASNDDNFKARRSGRGPTHTLAGISNGGRRTGNVHGLSVRFRCSTRTSRFSDLPGRTQPARPTDSGRHCDGADRRRNHLLSLGKAVRSSHESGLLADVPVAWEDRTLGRPLLCRRTVYWWTRRGCPVLVS